MPRLTVIAVLFALACTPNAPGKTKAPDELHSTPSGPDVHHEDTRPAVSRDQPPAAASVPVSTNTSTASSASATSASLPQTTASTTSTAPAPLALERLTYHALPQTHLGFYGVLTPPDYDAPENASRRYPVVVILHGSGSNEVLHGSLADDLGRDGVIYVLPRAPHPSRDQFAAGKEGYTAWPSYPAPWGEYGSPAFPRAEVDRLQVHKFYTRWIAESLLDARQRYRVTPSRAVVVGHSQGATFAHLFAADYPALVKAYVAYAGPSRLTVGAADGARQMASLRNAAVAVFLLHHEGDAVVDVANTKQLDSMMTVHGVKHKTQILPGGTHATDPEVRRLMRAFTREQCCGKERSTADIPVGAGAKLSVPPVPDILTFGPATCDEHVSGMSRCENTAGASSGTCQVYEAEPCASRSMGYRSSTFECVNSVWTRVAKAPAECGVSGRDPEVPGCRVQLFRTRPSEHSKTDGCDLVMRCGQVQTVVSCDANNDGTRTSHCECSRDGIAGPLPQNVYPGEAPDTCIAAAAHCVVR